MALQLAGLAILAWAAADRSNRTMPAAARQLFILAAVAVAVVALQLVPLPASVWTHLGGREDVARGFEVLGLATPSLPASLTPYASLDLLLALIPPLAMFAAIVRLRAYRAAWLTAALLLGTIAGIVLGVLQLSSSDYSALPWYLYPTSSFGVATGFFANGNHMAILLVVTLPFLAMLLASPHGSNRELNAAIATLSLTMAIVVLIGIGLNRTVAGIALAFPVLAASALIVLPSRSSWRRIARAGAGLLLVGAIGALAMSSTTGAGRGPDVGGMVHSRQEMLQTSIRMMRDFMPVGSGFGSYRQAYQLYEPRDYVTDIYVIHAHDDYLEIAVELGLAGMLLMTAFLAWWIYAVRRAWREADADAYAKAASIASAAILVHSFFDFPLRTAAIAVVFVMCLGLLVQRRAPGTRERNQLWPTRHVVVH